MNLQQFINYRKDCPICDKQLKLAFHSKKQQSYRYEDGRLIFLFDLRALKKGQTHYKVGYSFGLEDNSYYIEFYTSKDKRFDDEAPDFLRARFKELDKNLLAYRFFKYCPGCSCYNYFSNNFLLKKTLTVQLGVETEYIGMHQPIDNRYKIYKLLNNYTDGVSFLIYGKHWSEDMARDDSDMLGNNPNPTNLNINGSKLELIQTPLIKFVSKQETMARLNKLILFS
jgi:hypothetical protein